MPMVGMKTRPYYEEQVLQLSQHVNRPVMGPDGKQMVDASGAPQVGYDVGLVCGILTIELLCDIRDILMQLALSPIWWQGRAAMAQNNPLLVARDFPQGG